MAKITTNTSEEMIQIPRSVFEKYIEFEEALEDWLISQDKDFIERMTQARQEHLKGKCIPWEEAKKQTNAK